MLRLDDFDLETPKCGIATLKDTFAILTYACRVVTAQICMANIKLSSITGRVLDQLYALQAFKGPTKGPKILYSPQHSELDPRTVPDLESELNRWANQLPSTYQIQTAPEPAAANSEILYLHQAYLQMVYHFVVEALHRPVCISRADLTLAIEHLQQKSRPIVKECATRIAELVQSLRQRDLFRFLPPVAAPCIGSAVASFLVEMKSSGKILAELPREHFQQCISGLWSLREIWPIADAVCQVIDLMIRADEVETARVIALQASPIPTVDDAPNEIMGLRSQGTSLPHEALAHGKGMQSASPAANTDLAIDPMVTGSVDTVGHLTDSQDIWFMSNQFPWTITEFGLYGELFDSYRDNIVPLEEWTT